LNILDDDVTGTTRAPYSSDYDVMMCDMMTTRKAKDENSKAVVMVAVVTSKRQ